METLHNIGRIESISNKGVKARFVLMLVGIVTALICMLMLLYDAHATESISSIPQFTNTLKIVPGDFSIEVINEAVTSVLWPM